MADTKKLNLEITVDKKALTLLKESTKTTIAEIKALNTSLTAQIKADAQVKVQVEKTAQAQIKADAQKTAIELKANKQKEVFDYKQLADQKSKAEKQLLAELNSYSKKQTQAERDALAERVANWRKASEQISNQLKKDAQVIRQTEQRRLESVFRPIEKQDPKLQGQSVTLGSEQAIKEQIKYWQQYKSTLAGTNPQIEATTKHINQLKTALNNVKGGGASRSDWEHWENLTTVFAGIGTALYGAYMAGQQFISFITDAVKKAAELEVYSKTFIEIAGSTEKANQQLQQLYNASAGNLNETELVKYSNKMRLLGFTVEDTTRLLDIVERKADEVGVSFSEGESALQSFILTGRGRALKELGINLNEVTAEMDSLILASGKTKDAMQSEELEAIRLQAILNKYGDTLTSINQKQKDSGDRIKSLSTLYDKFTTDTGKQFLELFNKIFNIVEKTSGAFVTLAGKMGIAQSSSSAFGNSMLEVGKKIAIGMIFPITNLINEIDFLISEYEYAVDKFSKAKEGVNSDGTSNIDRPFNPRYDKNTQKIAKRGIGEEQITDKVTGTKGSTKDIPVITNEIDDLTKSIADLQAKLGITNPTSTLFFIYSQQITELQNKIDYLNSSFKDSTGLEFITKITSATILPKYDNSQNIKGQELSFAEQVNLTGIDSTAMQKEAYDKIVNGSQQALSNVENIFQILDIGTETFVGKLVSGFQSTLSIIDAIAQVIQSINTVKQGVGILSSLLSFVPGAGFIGTATAGIGSASGGGRNIGNLAGNGGGQSPIVNKIYINSSIDTQKFFGDGVTTFYKNRNLNTVG